MCMLKFRENEEAVSPVIGVILMVAITVILAAVIAAFVFGMSENIPDNKEVYLTTKMGVVQGTDGANTNVMIVTIQGGKDITALKKITYKGGHMGDFKGELKLVSDTNEAFEAPFEVGGSGCILFETPTEGATTNWVPTIIIRGEFADGTVKILAEKTVAEDPNPTA